MSLNKIRKEIVEFGLQLFTEGLVRNGQGNLSVLHRGDDLVAVTPSGMPYRRRKWRDICVVDLEGKLVAGRWLPTSELALHLTFYQQRQDVAAVVHVHAPFATAFSITGQDALPMLLNESAMALGAAVPVAHYGRPGTQALADITCEFVGEGSAAIMAHHGLVAVGESLKVAYQAALAVEATAQALFYARGMGGRMITLDDAEVAALRVLGKRYAPQRPSSILKVAASYS